MGISRINCAVFAAGVACVGILSLIYQDFAPMWQSLPNASAHRVWVYGSAMLLLAAAAGLCFAPTARPSLVVIAAYYGLWAVASAPPIFHDALNFGSWYGVCEAATSLAAVWILYATLRSRPPRARQAVGGERGLQAARIVFGLTCVFYGCSHFAYAEFTASFVPGWLPNRLGFAYATGLAYIAAGVAIVLGILPRLAANLAALMMSLFGLLVWVPSFFAQPRPSWAGTTQNQWSELAVNLVMAGAAWIVAESLRTLPWGPKQL